MSTVAADDLSSFRWHTGATLRPVADGEECPLLFRDIGPEALALFLQNRLPRLAGPLSPLVYMRTSEYVEPYIDHERIGRLAILQPHRLHVWHSGVPHVYVARARPGVDGDVVGFTPGELSLADAARLLAGATDTRQLREILGGRNHDEAVAETLFRLERLQGEYDAAEKCAAPLRKRLQAADQAVRQAARDEMRRAGLTEADLCAAWHHLSRDRRDFIVEALHVVEGRR